MNVMKSLMPLSLVAALTAIAVFTSPAQSYYLAGDFNSWNAGADPMAGGPVQYDFTITNQTPGGYGQIKVTDGTWNNSWPANNVVIRYDANGSATIHFYPGNATDGWLPLANRIGYDDPGNLSWGIAGDFNGWNGTNNLLLPLGNGVYSNSIVVATAGTFGFKFQSPPGSWTGIYFGSDFGANDPNGTYTTTNSPQTVPVVLDLPRGRYFIGNLAPSPVTNTVIFAVDMTYQIQAGNFHPGYSVYVSGDFNGWPSPGSGAGLALVNEPPYNGGSNTNIWYGTNTFVGLPGAAAAQYKFTQNDPAAPNSGWETSNNRTLTLLATNGTLRLPVVAFSDVYPSDVLSAPTPVFFSVNMTNAVGTDGHHFDPGADNVYINGQFANWYAWAGGINPAPAPPGYQMIEQGLTLIYTNTIILPAGTPIAFDYKYGMDPGGVNGGPLDDEAGYAQNHHRVVRSTALNPYPLATDTFGDQYAEPLFSASNPAGGNLQLGAPSNGVVPVTWLGRPGAHLQTATRVSGPWQDLPETDGTNWTTGYVSTNGFVSLTNWPVANQAFFRLIKP